MQKTNIEKMLMFPTKEGNFRQAIGLIKESCSYDPGLCVRISTRPSYDGSVEATFTTGNGIVAKASAAKGSDPLPQGEGLLAEVPDPPVFRGLCRRLAQRPRRLSFFLE